MPIVSLQNLGCSKNMVDGERIIHLFKTAGFEISTDLSVADIIVVNTCAFIKEAQEEAIDSILDSASFKKDGQCKTLIVSGCFSERFRDEVASQFPEVDYWVGVNDWEEILPKIYKKMVPSSFERELSVPVATQYLKIAEGCSHSCSFCVIPSIRGNFKSRNIESILQEALWLEEKGVQELILIAQDTSFYGRDIGLTLHHLLENLLKKTRFPWIRLMYLHPRFIDQNLLQLFAGESRLCQYFDVPLQHISEPVLRAMNRIPLTEGIYKLIESIRTTLPNASIRSSFILGFPGEKENHFEELKKFIEFARFDRLGVFPFSPEHGTRAKEMKGRPRSTTVTRRCEEIMLLQREISREIMESKIGTTLDVIIDSVSDNPDFNFEGRTRSDAPEVDGKVLISSGSFDPGTIHQLKIIGASDYDLFADPL
ncbi:MAG: 30S ribosomal protein S12 methylthiotransferase RimO [Fibrobacter sp.]|nr:30S ribosomal protein S12 methylthiotransferase RimO [Fibrobacter sp.]